MTGREVSEGLRAFARHAGEGEARWWLGSLSVILAGSRETGGQFALIDVTDPECAAPLHIHHREDEAFIVLEGEIEFTIGGQKIDAGPGSIVFGPRGVPHSYVVRKGPSRTLFLFTPGGFEEAVIATSEPARERRLPAERRRLAGYGHAPERVRGLRMRAARADGTGQCLARGRGRPISHRADEAPLGSWGRPSPGSRASPAAEPPRPSVRG